MLKLLTLIGPNFFLRAPRFLTPRRSKKESPNLHNPFPIFVHKLMSRLFQKMETLHWFLKRPHLYPQLLQLVKRNLNRKKEHTRTEATKWCESHAISLSEALKKLGINSNLIHPSQHFSEIWKQAERTAEKVPVKMGGAGAIDLLYTLALHYQPEHILETGVAYGWSSLTLLLAIKYNRKGTLVSVDMPYPKMNNDPYVGIVVPKELHQHWILIRKPDITGIPTALKKLQNRVDFFHYDSDKSYTGRMYTYPIIWKVLSSKGIFISDDIGDNIAFKDFSESVGIQPLIFQWNNKFVGILLKP